MKPHRPLAAIARVAGLFGLLAGMLYAIKITVGWWRGELAAGWWEWLWIGLLPVLIVVFLRYYSIFRPDCPACELPDSKPDAKP